MQDKPDYFKDQTKLKSPQIYNSLFSFTNCHVDACNTTNYNIDQTSYLQKGMNGQQQ